MVIKYDTCSYSGYKIAPGHGLRFCEVNGKTHLFINKKNHRLFLNGKKPLKIRWNLKWRTANKKGKVEEAKKKVQRQKKERQVKAIVGLSVEEINKKRFFLKKKWTRAYGVVFKATDIRQKKLLFKKIILSFSR